jgi:hypothetical protein
LLLFFVATPFGSLSVWPFNTVVLYVRAIVKTPSVKASFPPMKSPSSVLLQGLRTSTQTNIGFYFAPSTAFGEVPGIGMTKSMPFCGLLV